MKKQFFLIAALLVLACAKQYIAEPVDMPRDVIIRHLNMPYHFNVYAANEFMEMKYSGKKDALGKFEMKGYLKLGNEKSNYDVYYDGKWHEKGTGMEIEYDFPLNPIDFISTLIVSDTLRDPMAKGSELIFTDTVNTVFISPLNYLHMGQIVTDRDGYLKSINVDNELRINVTLKRDNSIYIVPQKKPLITMDNTFGIEGDIIRKRLETTGDGTVRNKILLFVTMDEQIEMLLSERHIYAGVFKYTEPMMDNREKFINGNAKNTAIITDTLGVFIDNEIMPIARGPYADIFLSSNTYPYEDNLCLFTENYIFTIRRSGGKLVIENVPEFLSGYLYALIKYQ